MKSQALHTVEEIFGEPLPSLTEEQETQLETTLVAQIATLFSGPYQPILKGTRNRELTRRVLVEGATLKQAAQEFGIKPSRVGQLRLKALRLLRHPVRSRPLRSIFKPVEVVR